MSGFQAFSLGGPNGGSLGYPTPLQWVGDTSFTVSLWLRTTPPADANTWILDVGKRGAYEGIQWALSQAPKQPLQAHFGFWGDPVCQNVFPFTPWVGVWVHLATVFDAAARTLTTYVNGTVPAGGSKMLPASAKIKPRQAGRVTIAAGPPPWRALSGLIDEIRIWDTPVPPDQIRSDMYRRLSVPQPHLISYVNVPASFPAEAARTRPALRAADTPGASACRDLVTNEPVEALGSVALVPSAVPTGSEARVVGAGDIAIFQAPDYRGHSWLFPLEAHEFDVRSDLSSCDVGSMRVGDHTAARIFAGPYYDGLSQEAQSDLPAMSGTRLAASKKTSLSVQVTSTQGRPQRGKWAIATAAGPFLSGKPMEGGAILLRRSSGVDDEGLFRVETLGAPGDRQEVSIQSPAHSAFLTAAEDGRLVFRDPEVTARSRFVMVAEPGAARFSLGVADGRCVASRADDGFELATDGQRREIFTLAFHAAADESEVGELPPGAVAFYEQSSYWGRAWVFPGAQADLRLIKALSVKSMRLGPQTGITLFDQPGFARTANAADVVHDTPDLGGAAFKGAAIRSFKAWRVVSPGASGLESVATLSQDYRPGRGKGTIEPFCAYRVSLGVPRNVAHVEVGVTESATLSIGGQRRQLGADEAWTVSPNPFGRLIVTSEASHLYSPGLKIRTDTMAADHHVVLFPDQEAHVQLATLPADALWEAKDHAGHRVLKDGVTREGAAQVQGAITAMMSATDYASTTVDARDPTAAPRDPGTTAGAAAWEWATSSRTITQQRMTGDGWILDFDAKTGSPSQLASGLQAGAAGMPSFKVLSAAELAQVWAAPPPVLRGDAGEFFDALWNEGKKIVHVVVRKAAGIADQIAVQIRYVGDVVRDFVVSTVTQAAAVAERIFHEVVTSVDKVIQWLAYLFDWDAILATQKELADNIVDALKFATTVLRAQQAAVDRGITAFRGQLKTSLEAVKARLATEPLGIADKRRQSAAARHPSAEEKLHWFMAKMAPQDGAATPVAKALALNGPPAELQNFIDTVRTTASRIVDKDVRAAFSQAFECFTGAFTDPNAGLAFDQLLAGMLSILEGIAEAGINLAKVIVDLLFGLVDKLLGWATTMLTAEIPIPGLTELWHLITKGTPLSVLNVATLAVAIPTTVIRKLVMQPTPTAGAAASHPAVAMLRAQVAATADDPDYGKKLASAIAYSCFALVNGALSIPLDAMGAGSMIAQPSQIELMERLPSGEFPPMPTKPGWASFTIPGDDLLEKIAWVTQAGMVVTSWPGGYPNVHHQFFPDDPTERWGSGLWIFEGALAFVDLLNVLGVGKKLRRSGEVQLVVSSILGLAHLTLVVVVMGVELAHKSAWYKGHVLPWTAAQGIVGGVSESLPFLMMPQLTTESEGVTLAAYLVTEGVATVADLGINLYLGIAGLIDPPEPA